MKKNVVKRLLSVVICASLVCVPIMTSAENGDVQALEANEIQTTAEETTPEETTPETTPEETTPETTPEETTPETTSEETKPETTPEETKPETTPEETKPETTPEETKPETTPEETKPETTPEETKPETKPEEETPTPGVEEETPAHGDSTFTVSFMVNGGIVSAGDDATQDCPFEKDKVYTFKASDFTAPENYYITNPDEEFTTQWVLNEETQEWNLSETSGTIAVGRQMPDPVPTLTVEYRCYDEIYTGIVNPFDDSYTTIYTDTLDGLTMSPIEYSGNPEAVAALGYEIQDNYVFPSTRTLSLNPYPRETIDGEFVDWVNTQLPVSINKLVFVVQKAGEELPLSFKIGFKTEDGKVVGNTYNRSIDKSDMSMTVNKENMPLVPSGYSLVDENQSFTVSYQYIDGAWSLDATEVYFTVKQTSFADVLNKGNVPTVKPSSSALTLKPATSAATVTTKTSAKTGDTTNVTLYAVLLSAGAAALAFFGIRSAKKKRTER